MFILTQNERAQDSFFSYLPPAAADRLRAAKTDGLCEIRLRKNRPVMLFYTNGCRYLARDGGTTGSAREAYIIGSSELIRACELVFENSLYAHEDELSGGFVTIRGGHRIGIAGSAPCGKIRSYGDISSLNYRIAHEHIGIAEPLLPKIIKGGRVLSTLIVSPPMCGKTSLLRDLIRCISSRQIRVGVCDTRREIAAVYDGEPCMDVSDADIISGMSKPAAMMMLLRCMSPEVIACDELGDAADFKCVSQLLSSGVAVIATLHAYSREALAEKNRLPEGFECIVTLCGRGEICEVYYA